MSMAVTVFLFKYLYKVHTCRLNVVFLPKGKRDDRLVELEGKGDCLLFSPSHVLCRACSRIA